MIVLAFVACLETVPDSCREFNLVFAEDMSPRVCTMQAQPMLAEWAATHPKWRIGRWRCTRAEDAGHRI